MPDDTLHRLLPRFLLGEISEVEMERFDQHLKGCEECAAEKAFLEQVQAEVGRHGEAVFEDHPTPDRLVAYLGRELSDEQAATVRRHLDLCATCAVEMRWISGEKSVTTVPPTAPSATVRAMPLWGWVTAAAAVLLAFFIPFSMLRKEQPTRSIYPQLIAQVERGDERGNVLYLQSGEPTLTAFFPVDLPTEAFPASVRVERDDGTVVHERTLSARDELTRGIFAFFECARHDCRPGNYVVRIAGTNDIAFEPIPFRVEERNEP